MNDANEPRPKWRWLRILATTICCIAILAGTAAAVVVINQTEPTAQQINATRKSAALVQTVGVVRGSYSPRIVVLGTVQAAQDIVLSPRVSGQVVELSRRFVPGGMVRKGELLLRIDPADFQNAVSIRESELQQREASKEIEQARQRLAEKELKMLEGTIDETNRALVMREPQIASIEAEVAAAVAEVERAKLDLERSSIFAPFDAQIQSRSMNVGSQVRIGDELGRLIGLEEYWIMAAVPVRSLQWIEFPDETQTETLTAGTETDGTKSKIEPRLKGSKVLLRHEDAWGPDVERVAHVSRMIGTLDQQTRLARVLITIADPLGQTSDAPPLILDTLIETEIIGRPIKDVVRLRREFVRDNDNVWVLKDDKLQIRQTKIVFQDAQYAYIREGLETGDRVVTTTLATVAEGVGLREIDPTEEEEKQPSEEGEESSPPSPSEEAPA